MCTAASSLEEGKEEGSRHSDPLKPGQGSSSVVAVVVVVVPDEGELEPNM